MARPSNATITLPIIVSVVVLPNKEDIPRRPRGIPRNTTRMYTIGKPFQSRVALPICRARYRGIRRMKGMGYQIRIPEILKNKCARATCRASVPSVTNAANREVMLEERETNETTKEKEQYRLVYSSMVDRQIITPYTVIIAFLYLRSSKRRTMFQYSPQES